MLNVFKKENVEELHVQLSDGRIVLLEDLVRDYESLFKTMTFLPTIRVGEWFHIDRDVIAKNQEKIYRQVWNEVREEVGKKYLERFEKSNKIADKNPNKYPRIIETYIFEHDWEFKTEQEMRDMCKGVGDGMCDEVICDLELQMRICNGESAYVLFEEIDKFPHVRVIQCRNGKIGRLGGGTVKKADFPPADILKYDFSPDEKDYAGTPYAFRRVLSNTVSWY